LRFTKREYNGFAPWAHAQRIKNINTNVSYYYFYSAPRDCSSAHRPRRCSALDEHFESVLEHHHIAIWLAAHLKLSGTDFERPRALGFVVAQLEAEPEVTGVLGHTAEGVHGALGVGCAVIF
jgi:hypothetical protein